jgi:HEAT repeats
MGFCRFLKLSYLAKKNELTTLYANLQGNSPNERRDAARAARYSKDRHVLDKVATLLQDADITVRTAAATTLGKAHYVASTPLLIRSISKDSLASFEPPKPIVPTPQQISQLMGHPPYLPFVTEVGKALRRLKEGAIPFLLDAVCDESLLGRGIILATLSECTPESLKLASSPQSKTHLEHVFHDSNENYVTRWLAGKVLESITGTEYLTGTHRASLDETSVPLERNVAMMHLEKIAKGDFSCFFMTHNLFEDLQKSGEEISLASKGYVIRKQKTKEVADLPRNACEACGASVDIAPGHHHIIWYGNTLTEQYLLEEHDLSKLNVYKYLL